MVLSPMYVSASCSLVGDHLAAQRAAWISAPGSPRYSGRSVRRRSTTV
jgi:hypothetical protein